MSFSLHLMMVFLSAGSLSQASSISPVDQSPARYQGATWSCENWSSTVSRAERGLFDARVCSLNPVPVERRERYADPDRPYVGVLQVRVQILGDGYDQTFTTRRIFASTPVQGGTRGTSKGYDMATGESLVYGWIRGCAVGNAPGRTIHSVHVPGGAGFFALLDQPARTRASEPAPCEEPETLDWRDADAAIARALARSEPGEMQGVLAGWARDNDLGSFESFPALCAPVSTEIRQPTEAIPASALVPCVSARVLDPAKAGEARSRWPAGISIQGVLVKFQ